MVHYYLAVRGPLSDKVGTLQSLARATRLLLLADVDKVPELVQVLVVGRRQLASDDSARHLHATHDVLIIPKQLGQPGGHEFCKQRDNIGGDVLVQEVRGGVQVVGQNNPTGGGERTHLHIAGQALQYLGVCLLCVSGVETHYLPRGRSQRDTGTQEPRGAQNMQAPFDILFSLALPPPHPVPPTPPGFQITRAKRHPPYINIHLWL